MGDGDTRFVARDSDTLARLRSLFDRLIDLSPNARASWLADNVHDAGERDALLNLLAADNTGDGLLDTPAEELAVRLEASPGLGGG
jgi:hypothetical protein